MDKQKQIEEIAKRIHLATDLYYIECIKIATYLFEKDNCRIVNEGSIVLTKEKYNQLVNTKKFFETADSQISVGNLLVYLDELKEQTCKETAMDIFQWLKGHTFDSSFALIKTYFKEQYGVDLQK